MRSTKTGALLAGLLLCASANSGWSHDTSADGSVHGTRRSIEEGDAATSGADPFQGTVIERRLGEGPAEIISVDRGTAVRLVLHAPKGTELHLHGYDLSGTATGGAPIILTFSADHPGRFAIEAHGAEDLLGRAEKALAYLEVLPE